MSNMIKSLNGSVTSLAADIRKHQKLYDQGKAVLEDAQFDALVERLRVLDPKHPVLSELGKPVVRKTIKHTAPQLSLQKIKLDELEDWLIDTGASLFTVDWKYDGVSVTMRRESDGRVVAITRGDGLVGDDISAALLTIPPVRPLVNDAEVRGEVVIARKVFEEKYSERFANTRNMISGALLSKTLDKPLLRDLTFVPHELGSDQSRQTASAKQIAQGYAQRMLDARDACPYDTDGIVIKVYDKRERERLGETGHHPKWAVAIKYEDERAITTIEDVIWQVSRTGTLTPVAIVKPVKLAGAMVSKATLHNFGRFAALGLCQGDTIEMTRRGAVIPHVERVVSSEPGSIEFLYPRECSVCGDSTGIDGEFLVHDNTECSEVRVGVLKHFASVMEFGDGWGEEIIRNAVLYKKLRTPLDFYTINHGSLQTLDRVGEKLERKLLAGVKREVEPWRLLAALGIDGIGRTMGAKLVEVLGPEINAWIDEFKDDDTLSGIEGMGAKLAKNLAQGLNEHRDLIEALMEHVTFPKAAMGPLSGESFVFTGALSDMSRGEAQEAVRRLGATTPAGVSKTLTHLVVGDGARDEQRGKRDKAEKANAKGASIKILSEEEFARLLAEASVV